MSQHHKAPRLYNEANVQLAISDIQCNQVKSLRHAEAIYNVPRRTIQRRRNATHSRRECKPNQKSLTKLEEEAIVQRILDESLRGIPPSKAHVRDMADRLLRERSGKPTGKN
jgi:hypothetical protein